MRPDGVRRATRSASIAYVPIGAIEYHGPHLPLGVDMMTAEEICSRACALTGGVVLPPSYLAHGTLDLPWTLEFSPSLVEAWAREVVAQLHHRGFAMVVLLTGHGPLDLLHLLKRVARETGTPERAVYAACYLEFNAVRLTGPELGEPTVIDHASTVETSYVLAIHPRTVDLAALPDDPDAGVMGVYGRNPRFTADAAWADGDLDAAASVLSTRVAEAARAGFDDLADLRRFVRLAWPESLELRWGGTEATSLELHNPGRASRFITGITDVKIDGAGVAPAAVHLTNAASGETGRRMCAGDLGPEAGLYLRRDQSATIELPPGTAPGTAVSMSVELGGVARRTVTAGASPPWRDHHATGR